jgi:hypothetical protein
MNRDVARRIIALVATERKNSPNGLTRQDFITTIAYKRKLMDPDMIERFIQESIKESLLMEKENRIFPNFSTSGIIVPLDFQINPDQLFAENTDKPIVDRMLDAISASGKMTKKEAISSSREIMEYMKLINFEVALMAVMSEEGIDISNFLKEYTVQYNKE